MSGCCEDAIDGRLPWQDSVQRPPARAHRDQPRDMSSVISFATALCHAITTFRCQRPSPPSPSLLTPPFPHHGALRFPAPEPFVPWCGVRLLQNCRTGSTDAKAGAEQKGARSWEARLVLAGSQRRKRTNAPKPFIQGRRQFSLFPVPCSLFPFPGAPAHHRFLVLAWSINRHSTVGETASHRKRQGEEVGHLLAGGGKAHRRPNSVYGNGSVVAAQVVIAQPPGFHVSCFPNPSSCARGTGH